MKRIAWFIFTLSVVLSFVLVLMELSTSVDAALRAKAEAHRAAGYGGAP